MNNSMAHLAVKYSGNNFTVINSDLKLPCLVFFSTDI